MKEETEESDEWTDVTKGQANSSNRLSDESLPVESEHDLKQLERTLKRDQKFREKQLVSHQKLQLRYPESVSKLIQTDLTASSTRVVIRIQGEYIESEKKKKGNKRKPIDQYLKECFMEHDRSDYTKLNFNHPGYKIDLNRVG